MILQPLFFGGAAFFCLSASNASSSSGGNGFDVRALAIVIDRFVNGMD